MKETNCALGLLDDTSVYFNSVESWLSLITSPLQSACQHLYHIIQFDSIGTGESECCDDDNAKPALNRTVPKMCINWHGAGFVQSAF